MPDRVDAAAMAGGRTRAGWLRASAENVSCMSAARSWHRSFCGSWTRRSRDNRAESGASLSLRLNLDPALLDRWVSGSGRPAGAGWPAWARGSGFWWSGGGAQGGGKSAKFASGPGGCPAAGFRGSFPGQSIVVHGCGRGGAALSPSEVSGRFCRNYLAGLTELFGRVTGAAAGWSTSWSGCSRSTSGC